MFSSIDELNENNKQMSKELALMSVSNEQFKRNGAQPVKLVSYNGNATNGNVVINGICNDKHAIKIVQFNEEISQETLSVEAKIKVRKMFYLCIAYSATIGSVSTLTANGPNLVMKDILEE